MNISQPEKANTTLNLSVLGTNKRAGAVTKIKLPPCVFHTTFPWELCPACRKHHSHGRAGLMLLFLAESEKSILELTWENNLSESEVCL